MADLFTLDADTLATVENGIDSLIHQLGKACTLVFETEPERCPNCNFDSTTGRSSNVYNGVGPRPFRTGKCPVCKGSGYLPGSQTTKQTVQLLVDWMPKPYLFATPNAVGAIEIPQGIVQTKGFAADLPRILQAKYIIIDSVNTQYQTHRFRLWKEPTLSGNIVKSKYFLAFWERFGD
jgi:hypothetical protein